MRYHRQSLVPEVGSHGQSRLMNARVLCVGIGGLGCPAALYLAGAGIGKLGLVDSDEVNFSNLHRQILFSSSEVGQIKVHAAKKRLLGLNPDIQIEAYDFALSANNVMDLFSHYDLVLDGTDQFSTKLLINDACLNLSLPWIYASVSQWQGQIANFNPRDLHSPCYRCFQPEMPKVQIQNCAESGVIGPIAGILGTQQALQALQLILGVQTDTPGKLQIFDGLHQTWMKLQIPKNPECPACSKPTGSLNIFDRSDENCDLGTITQISAKELLEKDLGRFHEFKILDVREPDEFEQFHLDGAILWPLGQLEKKQFPDFTREDKILVYCRSGRRSLRAYHLLKDHGFHWVTELKNGLTDWVF